MIKLIVVASVAASLLLGCDQEIPPGVKKQLKHLWINRSLIWSLFRVVSFNG